VTTVFVAATLALTVAGCGASGGSDSSSKSGSTNPKSATSTTEAKATTTTTEAKRAHDYETSFESGVQADKWDTGCGQKGCVDIEEGAYYTDVSPGAQYFLASDKFRDWTSGDVTIDMTITRFGQANPAVGATCMSDIADNTMHGYYDLLVSAEGRVSIYKFRDGKDPEELLAPTDVAGFDRTQPFTLEISCRAEGDGVHLEIGVDGKTAGTYVDEGDDAFTSGAVRLETYGDDKKLSTVYIGDFHIQAA
jgi:hypothetical protein